MDNSNSHLLRSTPQTNYFLDDLLDGGDGSAQKPGLEKSDSCYDSDDHEEDNADAPRNAVRVSGKRRANNVNKVEWTIAGLPDVIMLTRSVGVVFLTTIVSNGGNIR